MDKILVEALEIPCIIGIYDWERCVPQVVRIDLELAANIRAPARTDSITEATDYKTLSKALTSLVEGSSFGLIETLAETIAARCLEEVGIRWVRVTVSKPGALRGSRNVSVQIARGRGPDVGHRVFVGLGSNVDPAENVPRALEWLRRRFEVVAVSPSYCGPASGPPGQPDYVNLVAECCTDLDAFGVTAELQLIEHRLGRRRTGDRYEPRPCDLDLLLFDDLTSAASDSLGMTLPHPQVLEEAFVFVPLLDIAPTLEHPGERRPLRELIADRLQGHALERWDELHSSHPETPGRPSTSSAP